MSSKMLHFLLQTYTLKSPYITSLITYMKEQLINFHLWEGEMGEMKMIASNLCYINIT